MIGSGRNMLLLLATAGGSLSLGIWVFPLPREVWHMRLLALTSALLWMLELVPMAITS